MNNNFLKKYFREISLSHTDINFLQIATKNIHYQLPFLNYLNIYSMDIQYLCSLFPLLISDFS